MNSNLLPEYWDDEQGENGNRVERTPLESVEFGAFTVLNEVGEFERNWSQAKEPRDWPKGALAEAGKALQLVGDAMKASLDGDVEGGKRLIRAAELHYSALCKLSKQPQQA